MFKSLQSFLSKPTPCPHSHFSCLDPRLSVNLIFSLAALGVHPRRVPWIPHFIFCSFLDYSRQFCFVPWSSLHNLNEKQELGVKSHLPSFAPQGSTDFQMSSSVDMCMRTPKWMNMHMCAHAHGDQRSTLDIFLSLSPCYLLRQSLSLNLELIDSTSQVGQQVLGISLHPHAHGWYRSELRSSGLCRRNFSDEPPLILNLLLLLVS